MQVLFYLQETDFTVLGPCLSHSSFKQGSWRVQRIFSCICISKL